MKRFNNIVDTIIFWFVLFAVFCPEMIKIFSKQGGEDWQWRLAVTFTCVASFTWCIRNKPEEKK